MNLADYASCDATGLAALIAGGEVTPREAADAAARAIEAVNGRLTAVVETYPDRIEGLDEATLGSGPFRGVPFLMKDVGGHEQGRKIEFGSRLCAGLVSDLDTHFCELLRAGGLNILGRSNTPEFSIASSAENLLYGNTSTPWREGFSAGGSSGGAAAAVAAGIVPLAHGSDIGGSIRIPAAWCGGVGLKPSRGLIPAGPVLDEAGLGLAVNFVQSRSVRDTAAMLDCLAVPMPGDPFVVARPERPFAACASTAPGPLRIAWTTSPLGPVPVEAETAAAVGRVAETLAAMGHRVEEAAFPFDHEAASRAMADIWFFGFHRRIDGYAARTGRAVGPDTLEPVTLDIYRRAREALPERYEAGWAVLNAARRRIGAFFTAHDVLLSPTAATLGPPHGPLGLNHPGVDAVEYYVSMDCQVQYSFPFNVSGGPALSLPLAMHSAGLPIGVQIAGRPSEDHLLLGLAAALEQAMPWRDRLPPIHVSRAAEPA